MNRRSEGRRTRRQRSYRATGCRASHAVSSCCSLSPAKTEQRTAGCRPDLTSRGQPLPGQVSRTESPNGRVCRPAALADMPDTVQKPATSGTSGIQSGSSAHGCTPWENRKPSSIHTGPASEPVACTQESMSPPIVVFGSLGDARQRNLARWDSHREQFAQSVHAVLTTSGQSPRLAALHARLDEVERAAPAQRIDAIDMALVDAHAVAVGTPAPAEPTAEHANGLLAAVTADAYAAMNSRSPRMVGANPACGTDGCGAEPVVEV